MHNQHHLRGGSGEDLAKYQRQLIWIGLHLAKKQKLLSLIVYRPLPKLCNPLSSSKDVSVATTDSICTQKIFHHWLLCFKIVCNLICESGSWWSLKLDICIVLLLKNVAYAARHRRLGTTHSQWKFSIQYSEQAIIFLNYKWPI